VIPGEPLQITGLIVDILARLGVRYLSSGGAPINRTEPGAQRFSAEAKTRVGRVFCGLPWELGSQSRNPESIGSERCIVILFAVRAVNGSLEDTRFAGNSSLPPDRYLVVCQIKNPQIEAATVQIPAEIDAAVGPDQQVI
jgi:hypothetical protein